MYIISLKYHVIFYTHVMRSYNWISFLLCIHLLACIYVDGRMKTITCEVTWLWFFYRERKIKKRPVRLRVNNVRFIYCIILMTKIWPFEWKAYLEKVLVEALLAGVLLGVVVGAQLEGEEPLVIGRHVNLDQTYANWGF